MTAHSDDDNDTLSSLYSEDDKNAFAKGNMHKCIIVKQKKTIHELQSCVSLSSNFEIFPFLKVVAVQEIKKQHKQLHSMFSLCRPKNKT